MQENVIQLTDEEKQLLKTNEYYLFHEMSMQSLMTDDVMHGINSSLYLLKLRLDCGDIVLYKKDENGTYNYLVSHSGMKHLIEPITSLVNATARLTEYKGIHYLDLGISDDFQNLTLISLETENNKYILSLNNLVTNLDNKAIINSKFFIEAKKTMQVILKRAEMYERNMMAIETDLLTGANNRNSYENRTQKINSNDSELVYGLFDLFRLKYINDNFSHAAGDTYIKETAKILMKYWPKITTDQAKNTDSKHEQCIYRIGGDEFALLTKNEKIELTKIKALLAAEEVKMIDLGINEKVPLGLNIGIVCHEPGSHIKKTYESADAILSGDKRNMYTSYGLERRR